MAHLLVAAALAATPVAQAPQAEPQQPSANPAMYVVSDADTTVFIFGTFHALDGKSEWFSDRVQRAFNVSGELVLETLIPELPGAASRPQRPFRPVSSQPVDGYRVEPSASFLATTKMAISAGEAQGLQVEYGADMVLRRMAEAEGKQVGALETLDFQFRMFKRIPATAAPAPATVQSAEAMRNLSNMMAQMQASWIRGDQTIFVRMLDQLRQSSPETYRMMFADRNARWAKWVAARLQQPGTVFVAVGAGHLAGKDSLLVRLAEDGIESTRLN
jgi:hypothetical protein